MIFHDYNEQKITLHFNDRFQKAQGGNASLEYFLLSATILNHAGQFFSSSSLLSGVKDT